MNLKDKTFREIEDTIYEYGLGWIEHINCASCGLFDIYSEDGFKEAILKHSLSFSLCEDRVTRKYKIVAFYVDKNNIYTFDCFGEEFWDFIENIKEGECCEMYN